MNVPESTLRTNNGLDAVLGPVLVGPDRAVSQESHVPVRFDDDCLLFVVAETK